MIDSTESPLDYTSYINRKATFTISKWGSMPIELSPLRCASYGWSLEQIPCIFCKFCGVRLTIALPSRDITFYKAKLLELSQKLIEGHKESCVWKSTHCPDYFHIKEPDNELPLAERILEAAKEFPDTFEEILVRFNITKPISTDLKYYADRSQLNPKALLIASHGWRYRLLDEKNHLLACRICSKRLPLWERHKWQKEEGKPTLHLESHLPWCPWILAMHPESPSLTRQSLDHISQSSNRKRKIDSKENRNSLSRMQELKDVKRFMKSPITSAAVK